MNVTPRFLALGLPGTLTALCACGGLPISSAVDSHVVGDSATLTCRTLNDLEHPRHNWLTGIGPAQNVTGYFVDTGRGRVVYYVTVPPYNRRDYRYYRYPRGVTITSLIGKTGKTVSGYLVDRESPSRVSGFIENHGARTLYKDPHEGHGKDAVTEILGVNGSDLAVGFYVDRFGADVPFELVVTTGRFANLKPPGATSARATGINLRGDIVGWLTGPSGTKGFILRGGVYQFFSYPNSTSTQTLGLNPQDQIVGSYVDSSGRTHGFLLTGPVNHPQWQSFDNPKTNGSAVLTGIDVRGDVVGNYSDNKGDTRGFVCI